MPGMARGLLASCMVASQLAEVGSTQTCTDKSASNEIRVFWLGLRACSLQPPAKDKKVLKVRRDSVKRGKEATEEKSTRTPWAHPTMATDALKTRLP